jgi:hypothetical protein
MGLFGTPKTTVEMVISAGEYVAGKKYKLPVELADQFVARGYAAGSISREMSDDELTALRGNSQTVSL